MSIRSRIETALKEKVAALGFLDVTITLTHPDVLAHGDFATSIALALSKQAGKPPRAVAEDIVRDLTVDGVVRIEIAGPGFINFHLSPDFFAASLNEISTAAVWGSTQATEKKEIVVEYTDPNPFKAFHIGHLMSNAIGESIARLFESQGVTVYRANYQGDVGIHIACALWGIKQLGIDAGNGAELGRAYSHGATAYKNDPAAKEEINAINKIVYDKTDETLNEQYRIGRQASLDLFEKLYALLGTKFNRYFFESELAEHGKEIVLAHPHVFEDSDGAKVYKGEKVGLHTRVFLSAKGLPIYETKELALAYEKQKYFPNAETFYVVTANEITEYYKVVIAAMKEIDPVIAAKMHHVPHGMMRLPDGKMSSRTGNVITGESLLADLIEAAKARAAESRAENPQQLAEEIAVAAIKFQVLRQGTGKDIIFEQEKALSLEGDSGPYIQYAHARCTSILHKGKEAGFLPAATVHTDLSDLERTLYRFPDVVARAAENLEPHHVAHFLTHVAGLFNSWYAQVQVLDDSDAVPHKLAIVRAVQQTLAQGLHFLGIKAPAQM
jgi:arginyl-tRNA synthetase